jgi:hypothetical protein
VARYRISVLTPEEPARVGSRSPGVLGKAFAFAEEVSRSMISSMTNFRRCSFKQSSQQIAAVVAVPQVGF